MDNKIRLLVLEALLKRAEKKTIIKESLYAWVKGAAEAAKIGGKTVKELIAISLVAIRRSIDVGGVIKLTNEQMDSLEQFIANSKKAIRGIDFNAKTVNINEFRDSLSEIFYENRKWDSLNDNEKSLIRSYLANPEDLANAIDHIEKTAIRTAFDTSGKMEQIATDIVRGNLAIAQAGGKISEESIILYAKKAIDKALGRPVSDTLVNQVVKEVVPDIKNMFTEQFLKDMSALPEDEALAIARREFKITTAKKGGRLASNALFLLIYTGIGLAIATLIVKFLKQQILCGMFGELITFDFCRQEGAKPTRFR